MAKREARNQPDVQHRIVAIDELQEDPNNANEHPDLNLDMIEASLTAHGQVEPLVVQRSSMRVIGGNGRLRVMRRMGWTKVACNLVDCDDVTAMAIGIALNRTPELARRNRDRLGELLKEIQKSSLDTRAAGYDEDELDRLLNSIAEGRPPRGECTGFQVIVDFEDEDERDRLYQRLRKQKHRAMKSSRRSDHERAVRLFTEN